MALIKPVKGVSPVWGENCWIAENATIVGDVKMGDNCTIWFNAVVRGDGRRTHAAEQRSRQNPDHSFVHFRLLEGGESALGGL